MQQLTSFQAKYLRGLVHGLKPVVFVGQKGITTTVLESIQAALDTHELIKVKFVEFKEKRLKAACATEVEQKTGSCLAGMIGHIAIFYRRQPDPEKRKIALPR
jgi:RNA-binding protein